MSLLSALPGWSAERITFSYGALERSIDIEDLEIYAEEGRLTDELKGYARYFDPEDLEQFRRILTETANVDVVLVDRFLYTQQGGYILNIVGDFLRTGARLNGSKALRGALIQSAADPTDGLTLLNMLKRFAGSTVRIDIGKGIAIAREVDRAIYKANTAFTIVEQQANVERSKAAQPDVSERLAIASKPGPFTEQRISLERLSKDVDLPIDLYIPSLPGQALPRPAVVISHGLGSDRTSYAYLARHLVTHGFVVINVEHPGSNAEQINALLAGNAADVVPDSEFLQRPADISNLLTALEQRSQSDPKLRNLIDFERIGVLGQSFGAYTSLALAGAPLNFAELEEQCPPEVISLNISLLLQCQVETLANPETPTRDLSDPRVQAAFAINPITSVLFGEDSFSQIQTPTMVVAGTIDTVAPALPEQITPFTWLTAPDKYLLLMRNGTHFSTIGMTETNSEAFDIPEAILGPTPEQAQAYIKAMSLAFFEVHLDNNLDYTAVLTSNAARQLSRPTIPLSLVSTLTADQLRDGFIEAQADTTSEPFEPLGEESEGEEIN
ncbi:MAG: alpha/beta hydrolase [Cyanobacteria bacterium P01_A01_bin.114]